MPRWEVRRGDCRAVLAEVEENSVDSGVLDPPYALGFMGAEWDKFGNGRGMRPEVIAAQKAAETRNEPFGRSGKPAKPAEGEKEAFKTFMREVARQYFRILKPGAHVLVFGGTRTYHWMVDAWEDVGFEVRDQLQWLYGQGFPKNHNISKAIDKAAGVKPVSIEPADLGMANNPDWNELKNKHVMPPPTTQEAQDWRGFGTALKPACEPIMLARVPLEGTIMENVLCWGTGAINIDGCAVGNDTGERKDPSAYEKVNPSGRWPANVILDVEAAAILDLQTGVQKDGTAVKRNGKGGKFCHSEEAKLGAPQKDQGYGGKGGASRYYKLIDGCPIDDDLILYSHANNRFYYCAKPSKKEKEAGLKEHAAHTAADLTGRKEGSAGLVMQHTDGRPKANPYAGTSGAVPRKNPHPTVKPINLLRYLCRMVTPPGGTVVDAFAGVGSCGIAAGLEGFDYIGVELDPEDKGFIEVANARLLHWVGPSDGLSQTEDYMQVIKTMSNRPEPVAAPPPVDPVYAAMMEF